MDTKQITVVGLGYVGLPVAVLAAEKGYSVVGLDIDEDRVGLINAGKSPIEDEALEIALAKKPITATVDPSTVAQSDVAVIGYGPAGITAGIYGARKRLDVVLFGDLPGGEVRNSGAIENWPGDGETDGNMLADKLVSHLGTHKDMVNIVPKLVTRITKDGDVFNIATDGETYQAKTVVYTAGRHPRMLGVPGEEEFKNRGVSYCATCDAPLFPDKEVAVIGGGNTGAESTIMLQGIAKKIYLLHNTDKLIADPVLVENFSNDPKVEILYNTDTKKNRRRHNGRESYICQ